MYSLNNGRDAGSEYRIINRSGIAFYFVFIYRSNPTFPLFKNRFSDNLRLFKRQIVPIRIRNRFDFSTGSLSLSLFIRTRLEEHLTVVDHTAATCTAQCARLFFPLCLPSHGHSFPSLNTELEDGAGVPRTEWNACCFSVYVIVHPPILCSLLPLFPPSPRSRISDVCKSCLRTC